MYKIELDEEILSFVKADPSHWFKFSMCIKYIPKENRFDMSGITLEPIPNDLTTVSKNIARAIKNKRAVAKIKKRY